TTPTTAARAGTTAGQTPTTDPLKDIPNKAGKKVIEWWWPWGGMTGLQALAALAKDFNATHDDYQVKALQIETWGGGAKLLSAIAAGTPPSVETGGTFYDFWIAGGAQPLDDYIKRSKVINPTDMFDTLVKGAKLKGKTYGIPAIEDFLRWELCANQDLLQQHKLNPQELPQTWDDLYAWSKEITQVDSSGAIKAMGFDPLDADGAV